MLDYVMEFLVAAGVQVGGEWGRKGRKKERKEGEGRKGIRLQTGKLC